MTRESQYLWIGITLLVLAVLLMAIDSHCQVLCVEPPLQAVPDEVLRLQVEYLFMQKGYQVNCGHYDLAVSFYHLGVQSSTSITDFYSDIAVAPHTIIGSVQVGQRQVYSGAWTMTIRPRDKVIPLTRTHAASITTAVKNSSKLLKRIPYIQLE